jgi:hypothetical protein
VRRDSDVDFAAASVTRAESRGARGLLSLERMRTNVRLAGAILLCFAAACSTSTGGGHDGAAGADGGGADGNLACTTAVEHDACASEGAVCGSCSNPCQFCNQLRCVSGHWTAMESAPAPCFACGSDLQCQVSATYCRVTEGGAVGTPPSYGCEPTPSACLPTPTCDCLRNDAQVVASSCSEADAGAVTVTIAVP